MIPEQTHVEHCEPEVHAQAMHKLAFVRAWREVWPKAGTSALLVHGCVTAVGTSFEQISIPLVFLQAQLSMVAEVDNICQWVLWTPKM